MSVSTAAHSTGQAQRRVRAESQLYKQCKQTIMSMRFDRLGFALALLWLVWCVFADGHYMCDHRLTSPFMSTLSRIVEKYENAWMDCAMMARVLVL